LSRRSGPLTGPHYEDLPIEELARRQGVRPIDTVDELADPDAFESEEDLEDFLAFIDASRRADQG
jgi:hypothetical protein